MARREYTQTIRPVSRIAEKIFGWLAWVGLLLITGGLLFFSLVMVNDQAFIDQFTAQFQQSLEGQNLEGFTPEELTQATLGLLNNFWMFALYLALPLILGLFGLLTMKRRILSGFLLLIAGLLTAPLVFAVVTGLIPLFFIIAAILLFVRKDQVIMDDGLEPFEADRGGVRDRSQEPNAGPVRHGRDVDDERDRNYGRNQELEREREYESRPDERRRATDDDVRTDRDYQSDDRRDRRNDDIEETRRFNRIDDEQVRDDKQRNNYVDGNIDSSDAVEPVTDEEYDRTHGYDVDDRNKGRDRRNRDGDRYGYEGDAASERRQNVDRRNNGDL